MCVRVRACDVCACRARNPAGPMLCNQLLNGFVLLNPAITQVTRVSTVVKCVALATSMLGFPLATYFHPAGASVEETNPGGASQWSMVGALIAYYMTYSWDIHVVLRTCENGGAISPLAAANNAKSKQQQQQAEEAKWPATAASDGNTAAHAHAE